MDPAKGFLAAPRRRQVPEFCGRCHSDAQFMRQYNPSLRVDQVAEYVTSVHGRRLIELGDTAVAVCTSCHPAHSIKRPSVPSSSVNPLNVAATCGACHADAALMQPYGIPTDQVDRYRRSIHWEMMSVEGDLSAPTCNDCHGNHGAAPPGITWVGNVCGQCHSVMADNFSQSRHAQTFAMLGVPGCATCHQKHDVFRASDEMLGLGEGAVCARCHASGDPGGQAATTMRALLDSLDHGFHVADSILERAEQAGMEVSAAQFDLGSANNAAVQARAAMHAFDVAAVRETVEEGLGISSEAYARGQDALDELDFRRTGLAVSTVIILTFIVGLVLKIRELERRPS
jgi:predicted CXXCH cytochrome family protein